MKKNVITSLLIFSLYSMSYAQTDIPKGYVKGSITLIDNSIRKGYIKDELKSSASIAFIEETGSKKKIYDWQQLNSATIDAIQFVCIKGDFFKVISTGNLALLQKASNVSGKLFYNGPDPYIQSGTDGKIGDYFFYPKSSKKLIHLSKKEYQTICVDLFTNRPDDLKKIQMLDFSKGSFIVISNLYDNMGQVNN